jgi:osmoprotectant transport system permease protein
MRKKGAIRAMGIFGGALRYISENQALFWQNLATHVQLSVLSLLVALVVCLPLGVWAARSPLVAQLGINTANALRVVPSLAILFLAFPYFGLGPEGALIALTLLACPPIIINTYAGFRAVDRAVVEAARGMGMSNVQTLRRVEFPLALPVLLAGVRIATVEVIASAALAAYIAAGGLGVFIQRGFSVGRTDIILVGAIPIALLALLADALLAGVQRAASLPAE